MRFTLICLVSFMVFAGNASAKSVYCTNCSTRFTQALDRVTNLKQLDQLVSQYKEDIQQTAHQMMMVKQNIEQLADMARNTKNLDPSMLSALKHRFMDLGGLVTKTAHQRGEADTLVRLYQTLYPTYDEMGRLVRHDTPEANAEALRRYQEWSNQVDGSVMATFRVSGSQLEELAGSDEFEAHVQDLLNSPEGRMEALQAANQLSAMQIEENRKIRTLLATSIQSQSQVNAKTEKQDQFAEEAWRRCLESDVLSDAKSKSFDPLPSEF